MPEGNKLAFALINTELGKEGYVMGKLGELEGVTERNQVYGIYDFLVRVEGNDLKYIKNVIETGIKKIDSVRSILTMFVADQ